MAEVPSEDRRKRADKDGRRLYTCGRCGRFFLSRCNLASASGARVSVSGAILDPPEARCMLDDDFCNRWWPQDEPLPDLLEIDRKQREVEAATESERATPKAARRVPRNRRSLAPVPSPRSYSSASPSFPRVNSFCGANTSVRMNAPIRSASSRSRRTGSRRFAKAPDFSGNGNRPSARSLGAGSVPGA